MASDAAPTAGRRLRSGALRILPLLLRLGLLCAALALVGWAVLAGHPATTLVGLLCVAALAAELLRFCGRRERTLLRVIETWAAGERATTAQLTDSGSTMRWRWSTSGCSRARAD
jgi:hypothetical protein